MGEVGGINSYFFLFHLYRYENTKLKLETKKRKVINVI